MGSSLSWALGSAVALATRSTKDASLEDAEGTYHDLVYKWVNKNLNLTGFYLFGPLPPKHPPGSLARAVRQSRPDTKIIMTSGFPGMRFNESELAKSLPLLSKLYRKQDLIRMISDVLNERSTAT